MKIAIVGGSGHYRYALSELKNHTLLGIAAGVIGEDLEKLKSALQKKGLEASVFDDWKKLVKDADVAVVATEIAKADATMTVADAAITITVADVSINN